MEENKGVTLKVIQKDGLGIYDKGGKQEWKY